MANSAAAMPDWAELIHVLPSNNVAPPPPSGPGVPPPPPSPPLSPTTLLAFDPYSELLWSANASGQLTSYYSAHLARYSSFPAHRIDPHLLHRLHAAGGGGGDSAGVPSAVRGILVDDRAVYSLGHDGARSAVRRGLARWEWRPASSSLPPMNFSSFSFSPLASSSDLILAGATTDMRPPGDDSGPMLAVVNKGTGSFVRKASSDSPISFLRRSAKYACAGTSGGHIQLRDPRSLSVEHRLHAHPGGIIDMAAEGNTLYSVGWTVRLGHPVPEPLVKVHDLRMMRALVPIPFAAPGGPSHLAIHPKVSSTLIVAAPQGQFQMVSINNPGDARFYQLNTSSFLTAMAVSPSADYLAFSEADGSVRLWVNNSDPTNTALRFNAFATPAPEGPDLLEPPEPIQWTPETPLSSIGLPYYDEPLLSMFDAPQFVSDASPLFNPPAKIDPVILSTLRTVDGIAYAPLPRHLRGRRNVVKGAGPGGQSAASAMAGRGGGPRRGEDRRRIGVPLFRSEKEKERAKRIADGREASPSSAQGTPLSPSSSGGALSSSRSGGTDGMPSYYRVKTIQYSRFGIEDFDFEYYNRTSRSGLETHIQNSYANAYLQALHYLQPFRTIAIAHTLDAELQGGGNALPPCTRENCLLCEAGFLFRMLEDAKGANCQATNFLRAFGNHEKAATLGLMDKDDSPGSDTAYSNLAQTLNRFMLDTTLTEANVVVTTPSGLPGSTPGSGARKEEALLDRLFSNTRRTRTTCSACGSDNERPTVSRVIDLVYPRKGLSNEPSLPSDFCSVLRASLLRETIVKGVCRSCNASHAPLRHRRVLPPTAELPQALSINASVHTADHLSYWLDAASSGGKSSSTSAPASHGYLPPRLSISVDDKTQDVRVSPEFAAGGATTDQAKLPGDAATYELRSLVVQIQADKEAPHLCALVRIRDDELDEAERQAVDKADGGEGKGRATWYLFNDFLVKRVSQEEALRFPASWKVPAVMFYERIDAQTLDLDRLPRTADRSILSRDTSIAWRRDPKLMRHVPLDSSEFPHQGTLTAIDAEFVALNQEELEVRSDGTRSVIRPSRLSLARVSVLRGEGEREGEPFLDDHIHTREPVVDYLTQFSGIMPGDLDPATSKHTLVPQKVAYKKLRLLVDLGCKFVGHGLKKDFRIINIYVPPSQVIDTVELYQSPDHARKLSLRFLTWFLLKEDIQAGGAVEDGGAGHDSIEDAYAALRLFRLWEQFNRDGRLDAVLEDLYETGARLNWKPPLPSTKAGQPATMVTDQGVVTLQ